MPSACPLTALRKCLWNKEMTPSGSHSLRVYDSKCPALPLLRHILQTETKAHRKGSCLKCALANIRSCTFQLPSLCHAMLSSTYYVLGAGDTVVVNRPDPIPALTTRTVPQAQQRSHHPRVRREAQTCRAASCLSQPWVLRLYVLLPPSKTILKYYCVGTKMNIIQVGSIIIIFTFNSDFKRLKNKNSFIGP